MLKCFYKFFRSEYVLINKAFKIIDEKLSELLIKKGFEKIINENNILFVKEKNAYGINFNQTKNNFELFYCMLESKEIISKKVLSTWLFDPQNDTEKEAKDIAADFVITVADSSKITCKKNTKNGKKSDDDNNTTPLFLINRIANVFPELKDIIQEEKENYQNFRYVTFSRTNILPIIKEILINGKPKDKFKKLCTIFSNSYSAGNLDTKAIITIVFLNEIENVLARENIADTVSNELKIAMKEANKLKGKKIKPEKIKKKSTFISDNLNASQKN